MMAKKRTVSRPARRLTGRDLDTFERIKKLADQVCESADLNQDPAFAIPSRTLSNVRYSRAKKILEMGSTTSLRQLFNLNQAKSYMQLLLIASGCNSLLYEGKTTSLRGLYYMLKHSIPGAGEPTFHDQSESDPIIEDLEVTTSALREELHLYAEKRGDLVGEITLIDSGDTIRCDRMGSGGYGIPSIVESDIIQFKDCKAKFILHVEKGTVWQRFNEDKFWKKNNCLLTHGGGQPSRGVRRLLFRLHEELGLPIYCLLDNDPWGYYIYSVIKQGSINLAYESRRMAIPAAKFLGIRSKDYEACGLSSNVQITLNDSDRKRARQIAQYPWFVGKKAWQQEIAKMLDNGFKLEVESLLSKHISYVTEEYTPKKIHEQDWLD